LPRPSCENVTQVGQTTKCSDGHCSQQAETPGPS